MENFNFGGSQISRGDLVQLLLRVSFATVITFYSVKWMMNQLDPTSKEKKKLRLKTEDLLKRLSNQSDFCASSQQFTDYEMMIASHLVVPSDIPVSWNDIAGLDSVVQELRESVVLPVRHRDLFNHSFMQWQRETINNLIEEAIMEADQKGIKVLSLGLLNQDEKLNKNGEVYIRRHPQLKIKLVDGSSLAVAVVLNSIPKGTTQVVLGGHLSKVANAIALALCQGGVKVMTLREEEYKKLKSSLTPEAATNLLLSKTYTSKIWLVGDGLNEDEQLKVPQGTIFIPFSQFPPRKTRKDCFYFHTPAMITPKHFENVDSCENWLPRRVMSAWRIAGILHALEDWHEHECGNLIFDIEKVWKASLDHGFQPISVVSASESKA